MMDGLREYSQHDFEVLHRQAISKWSQDAPLITRFSLYEQGLPTTWLQSLPLQMRREVFTLVDYKGARLLDFRTSDHTTWWDLLAAVNSRAQKARLKECDVGAFDFRDDSIHIELI